MVTVAEIRGKLRRHFFVPPPITDKGGNHDDTPADLDDDYQGGVVQVDWPVRLDLLFTNEPLLGPTWTWISPTTGGSGEVASVPEA